MASTRVRQVLGVLVPVVAVTLLAACGQTGTGAALGPSMSISPGMSFAAPSPTPMDAMTLQGALLTPPEVGEGFQYAGTGFLSNASLPFLSTDDADCQVLAGLLMNEATRPADAQATATFSRISGSGEYVGEVIRSYDDGLDASDVDDLDAALQNCDSFSVAGIDITVTPLEGLPEVGDSSTGARLEVSTGQSVEVAVARTGYQVVVLGAFYPAAAESLITGIFTAAVEKVESLQGR